MRARGTGGRREGWAESADGVPRTGLRRRRWRWWQRLGQWQRLRGRLRLRRLLGCRGDGGRSGVVEGDSPSQAGKVRERAIGGACGRQGVEGKEARQQGSINERGPCVRIDLRGSGVARPRKSSASLVYCSNRGRRGCRDSSVGEVGEAILIGRDSDVLIFA